MPAIVCHAEGQPIAGMARSYGGLCANVFFLGL